MENPLITVLMSTYNETGSELKKSINSILHQSYRNIEFLIINDNPKNNELLQILNSITDDRVKVIRNEKNIGLVRSLNKGLKFAQGTYIARMDADDISYPSRLEDELVYLKQNGLDMVGSYIELIDEDNTVIKRVMKFPSGHKQIAHFMRWGNCISHPTWLLKREVYMAMDGYRNALHCEDYDFILRAIEKGYAVGNIPKVELSYRVRQTGVSKSNENIQFLLRNFLAKNKRRINKITETNIEEYLHSEKFQRESTQLLLYKQDKIKLKQARGFTKIRIAQNISINPFLWKDLMEKVTLWMREL